MFSKDVTGPARSQASSAEESSAAQVLQLQQQLFDVIVVGAGISGAQSVYHLLQSSNSPKSILLVDHGAVGKGSAKRIVTKPNTPLHAPKGYITPDDKLGDERVYHPQQSGGVIFSAPHFNAGPNILKMMVRLYPATTVDFIGHHGEEGTRRYLRMSALGIELQCKLAKKTAKVPISSMLEECGSLLVADRANVENLEEEYHLLRKLGCDDVELWGEDKLVAMHGAASDFVRGIYFPHDARIDALAFTEAVLAAAKTTTRCKLTIVEHCPTVTDIFDRDGAAHCRFANGAVVKGNHLVMAAGGLFLNMHLAGIVVPCWSYFVALPHGRDPHRPGVDQTALLPSTGFLGGKHSINFFTYGFTHDWCVTQGVYRISGADHFSALKPPRALARSQDLASWSLQKYPYMKSLLREGEKPEECAKGRMVYGVYSETPDKLPVVGMVSKESRICYLMACNAWGQASLSYAASLVPGLLGYAELTTEQAACADLMAISRFKTQSTYLEAKL